MVTCVICYVEDVVEDECIHFSCCSRAICKDCVQVWLKVQNETLWIVRDSPCCAYEVQISEIFEKFNQAELEKLNEVLLSTLELTGEEKWLHCIKCGNREIGEYEDVFFKCLSCNEVACQVYHKMITAPQSDDMPTDVFYHYKTLSEDTNQQIEYLVQHLADITDETKQEQVKEHEKCLKHSKLVSRIAKIVDENTQRRCPECQFRGRKDYACNHIYCTNCGFYWCYICKQEASSGCGCPQYLTDIVFMRSSWSYDPIIALDKFHTHVSLMQLNQMYESFGENKEQIFDELYSSFPHIFNGFDKCEITCYKRPLTYFNDRLS